jgi:G:T-mismatch repair DNA endonuclease (very short patch repair protein)
MPFKPHPTDPTKVIYKTGDYWIPKPWQGLTDDERDAITKNIIGFNSCSGWEDEYAKAIEAKLKEKNGG